MGVVGEPVWGSLEFPVHRPRFDFFDVVTGRINIPLGMAGCIPDQTAAPGRHLFAEKLPGCAGVNGFIIGTNSHEYRHVNGGFAFHDVFGEQKKFSAGIEGK